jgi:putative chitinase
MPIELNLDMFDHRWPLAPQTLIEGMVASSQEAFNKYGVAEASVASDFMAQVSEECNGGAELEENLNYTPSRLHQVWPSKFASISSALPYAHNPRALADFVYNGRMGNQRNSNDGWTYRGRGLIQITGRSWYATLGEATKLDLINHPELALAPAHALECALAFWKLDGVSAFAEQGNFRGETLRINGSYNGLASRLAWRAIWRREFGI